MGELPDILMLNHMEFMVTNEEWVMYLGSTYCEEHSTFMGWYVHVKKHISIKHDVYALH